MPLPPLNDFFNFSRVGSAVAGFAFFPTRKAFSVTAQVAMRAAIAAGFVRSMFTHSPDSVQAMTLIGLSRCAVAVLADFLFPAAGHQRGFAVPSFHFGLSPFSGARLIVAPLNTEGRSTGGCHRGELYH